MDIPANSQSLLYLANGASNTAVLTSAASRDRSRAMDATSVGSVRGGNTATNVTYACMLACLSFLLLLSSASAIWPFPQKRFTKNSLIDAGSMGVDGNARIVAFGDFNGDQLCVPGRCLFHGSP